MNCQLKNFIRGLIPWKCLESFIAGKLLVDNKLLTSKLGKDSYDPQSILRDGVNVIGFHNVNFGLGQGVRATCDSLEAAGIKVNRIDFTHVNIRQNFWKQTRNNTNFIGEVNIIQVNPLEMGTVTKCFGLENFTNRYNIGYWVWEQSELPICWKMAKHYVQEIWTPSNYCAEVIKKSSLNLPVSVVPHSISIPATGKLYFPHELGIPKDKKLLLCMFDMNSTAVRKNPEGSLRAIIQAGAGRKDVCVIAKTRAPEVNPAAFKRMQKLLDEAPDYRIITADLSEIQLFSLLKHATALVSLHRSEGFGLFLAQAMAVGCPVVATGYSGNMEFMNSENSWPVDYKLIANKEHCPPYYKGLEWAEPDIDDAAMKVQWILEHEADVRKVIVNAQQALFENLSAEEISKTCEISLYNKEHR